MSDSVAAPVVLAPAPASPAPRLAYSPLKERLFTGVVTGSGAFVLLMLGFTALLVLWPQMALWLPQKLF